jgi:DNA-binding MarR family transcriptional regulator
MQKAAPAVAEQSLAAQLEPTFRPTGVFMAAENAIRTAIERIAVAQVEQDPTTLDLLMRLSLAPNQELRGVDLCRQLLKSPSHVSRIIDRAERDGLVLRRPDPSDRRAQQITLTDSGAAAVDAFLPHLVEVLDQTLYKALTDDEIDTLVGLLARIVTSAEELLEQQAVT